MSSFDSNYEIVFHKEFPKVRHRMSGELMHAVGSSDAEIETIYIGPSRLRGKLQSENDHPLVLWDVGLGASLNVSAAIQAAREIDAKRQLRIVSFENDLSSAQLVCHKSELFPSVNSGLLKQLLENKRATNEFLDWILVEGDFAGLFKESLQYGMPEICFFDPFSPKTDTGMWTFDLFREINSVVANQPFELFTYSQSTAVRSSLLAAGFFVAKGGACPPKESSTIACSRSSWGMSSTFQFLDEIWLNRWHRSSSQFPHDLRDKDQFFQLIVNHEQFKKGNLQR